MVVYRYSDNIEMMVAKQRELQEGTFGYSFDDMPDEEKIEYIRWNVLALTDELHEMLQETSWKPWAKSTFIRDSAFDELIDAWHFLMNLFLATAPRGMEPHDVARMVTEKYRAKREVNIKRQNKGYDGYTTKCPGCSRALDEPNGASLETVKIEGDEGVTAVSFACAACKADVTFMVESLL